MTTTMNCISNKIIDDEVLMNYSYKGAGKKQYDKKPFDGFHNIIHFIVQTTMVAYNEFHDDKDGFVKITEDEVKKHLETLHLKYAKQRTGKK